MQVEISEISKQAFEAAAKKLGLTNELPATSHLRSDLGHYLTANYMLIVIIEADKNGEIYDITNHDKRKYSPLFYCDDGYTPGSSAGGFSDYVCAYVIVSSAVGARLTSNSSTDCRTNAEKYPDLWEIVMLNVK